MEICVRCKSEFIRGFDRHDCAYVRAINALIPEAEAEADAHVAGEGYGGPEELRDASWNRAFHAAMRALAVEEGLRR